MSPGSKFVVRPLVRTRWPEFVRLFGPRGACGGCWCMTPRLSRAEYERWKGEGNKRKMQKLVEEGPPPGLLAYLGGKPVAWCAMAPRERFRRLANSRILAPVDDQPVWSIACFFVAKEHRNRGISVRLLEGAAHYAKSRGARIIEGYPVEPRKNPMPEVFAYTGIASAFRRVGFIEVARRSATRPILRLEV